MPPLKPNVDDRTRSEAEPDAAVLLAGAVQHGRELVQAEFALAKAELKQELARAQTGAMAMVVGITVGGAALAHG